jgi:hypothetical protein
VDVFAPICKNSFIQPGNSSRPLLARRDGVQSHSDCGASLHPKYLVPADAPLLAKPVQDFSPELSTSNPAELKSARTGNCIQWTRKNSATTSVLHSMKRTEQTWSWSHTNGTKPGNTSKNTTTMTCMTEDFLQLKARRILSFRQGTAELDGDAGSISKACQTERNEMMNERLNDAVEIISTRRRVFIGGEGARAIF